MEMEYYKIMAMKSRPASSVAYVQKRLSGLMKIWGLDMTLSQFTPLSVKKSADKFDTGIGTYCVPESYQELQVLKLALHASADTTVGLGFAM